VMVPFDKLLFPSYSSDRSFLAMSSVEHWQKEHLSVHKWNLDCD